MRSFSLLFAFEHLIGCYHTFSFLEFMGAANNLSKPDIYFIYSHFLNIPVVSLRMHIRHLLSQTPAHSCNYSINQPRDSIAVNSMYLASLRSFYRFQFVIQHRTTIPLMPSFTASANTGVLH